MNVNGIELDKFTQGYLECALWAMPAHGEPSDADYDETPGDGVSICELPANPDRWVECGGGIHFFLTRWEAENY